VQFVYLALRNARFNSNLIASFEILECIEKFIILCHTYMKQKDKEVIKICQMDEDKVWAEAAEDRA